MFVRTQEKRTHKDSVTFLNSQAPYCGMILNECFVSLKRMCTYYSTEILLPSQTSPERFSCIIIIYLLVKSTS